MEWVVSVTARFITAVRQAYRRKWSFFGLFLVVFLLTFLPLFRLGFVPESSPLVEERKAEVTKVPIEGLEEPVLIPELPVKIEIDKINLAASIENPTSTKIDVLDAALLSGAVRYPTSAKLAEEGNVILFGHSSYLPVVRNQAFKTFDDIQKLVAGDQVLVYSHARVYTYNVVSVTKENAESAALPLTVVGKRLTLSTCDSFGTKSDRFVVVADFVESNPILSEDLK